MSSYDEEKNVASGGGNDSRYLDSKRPVYVDKEGAVPGETFEIGDSWSAKLQRFAGQFGVEQRGIERVPDTERTDTSMINVTTMVSMPQLVMVAVMVFRWLSANMVSSSFAIGVLGYQLFYLGFVDSILVIFFFNILGIFSVCFFSAFGPLFGLRQMVLSRFWFGFYGVKLIAVFNCLACLGWSAVNSIVAAQALNAVNDNVPGWAGIIIVAISTLLIVLFGYQIVHVYERYSWIPVFIILMIVLGELVHSGAFQNIPMGTGNAELGAVLSFGSVVFGFSAGWASYAADYTVYQPTNAGKQRVFRWTWIGLMMPLLFTQVLGAAVSTTTGTNPDAINNAYLNAYKSPAGIGGLLREVLVPPLGNFGKLCLVVLALSTIASNCPNIYSVSLTAQVLGRRIARIPRYVLTVVCTGIYVAISIPGYSHFEIYLEDFMNFIGYWIAIYQSIALTEHFVFRKGFSGYNPSHYDHPELLPPGFAAVTAFGVGIAGMMMGMSQVWFVGPVARHVGVLPYGGDVGFELAFAFASLAYLVLRVVEKKYFRR